MTSVPLHCGEWRAEIAPQTGGALYALTHAGRPILRPTDQASRESGNVRRSACYPMIPYANRIADGRFEWGGEVYQLAMNFGNSPHPLHGVGWQRAWTLLHAGEDVCALEFCHRPVGDEAAAWPFPFTARQEFRIDQHGLTLSLTLFNDDDRPRPLGFGWHPFFHRSGGEVLQFSADQVWTNDRRCLPERAETPQGVWDHRHGQPIGGLVLDHDYTGWNGVVRISSPARQLILRASPSLPILRVFTPPEASYFAVEPVSHGANGLNRPDGMAPVPPGGSVEGSMSITNLEAA